VVDFLLASIVKASILVFYKLDRTIPMNVGAYGSVVIAAAGKYGIFCCDEKVCHTHRTQIARHRKMPHSVAVQIMCLARTISLVPIAGD
jgi:hypothetical protein